MDPAAAAVTVPPPPPLELYSYPLARAYHPRGRLVPTPQGDALLWPDGRGLWDPGGSGAVTGCDWTAAPAGDGWILTLDEGGAVAVQNAAPDAAQTNNAAHTGGYHVA